MPCFVDTPVVRVLLALSAAAVACGAQAQAQAQICERPVYLTIDTGHMGVAPLIAEVLKRQEVKATFFLANERTRSGGASLDEEWAPWWQARAEEGHAFGSHTWNHDVFKRDARAASSCGRRQVSTKAKPAH